MSFNAGAFRETKNQKNEPVTAKPGKERGGQVMSNKPHPRLTLPKVQTGVKSVKGDGKARNIVIFVSLIFASYFYTAGCMQVPLLKSLIILQNNRLM